MPNLFDAVEADRLKEEGMAKAAVSREVMLTEARYCARLLVQHYGQITVDDVYRLLAGKKWNLDVLGPAAGSIFKGKSWEFTGEWRKSTRVSNHGRMVRVWRLKA